MDEKLVNFQNLFHARLVTSAYLSAFTKTHCLSQINEKASNKKRWKTIIVLEWKSSAVTSAPCYNKNSENKIGTQEKTEINNNQVKHPRKWDLKEWSRTRSHRGPVALQKILNLSIHSKELRFKNIINKGPLQSSSRCLWHVSSPDAFFFDSFLPRDVTKFVKALLRNVKCWLY